MSELSGKGGADRDGAPNPCGVVFLEQAGWRVPEGKGELVLWLRADEWREVEQACLRLELVDVLEPDWIGTRAFEDHVNFVPRLLCWETLRAPSALVLLARSVFSHREVLVARDCFVPCLHSQSEQIELGGVVVLEVVSRFVNAGALGEVAQVESEVRGVSARGFDCSADFQGGP